MKVFRSLSRGGRKRVGSDRDGRCRVGEDKANGPYYAVAKPSVEPGLGLCVPATSDEIRVR